MSLAKTFKALGDESRLSIIQSLLCKDYCACEFTSGINKNQTTLSRHLTILVNSGLIVSKKEGRNVIYKLKSNEVKKQLLSMGIKPIKCC